MSGVYGGYHPCPCRDCFDVAIGGEGDNEETPSLCGECGEAGCNADGEHECQRDDAYGAGEVDND